jgi:hypothetical protein
MTKGLTINKATPTWQNLRIIILQAKTIRKICGLHIASLAKILDPKILQLIP